VDIEEVTALDDRLLVAAEILGPSELSSFRTLSAARQAETLIRIWTAKEACLKALGTGLAIHPQRLVCRLTNGDRVAYDLDGRPLDVTYAWNMSGPEYAASIVALEGRIQAAAH